MVTFSMMIGSGGASKFSLHHGAVEKQDAGKTIGMPFYIMGNSPDMDVTFLWQWLVLSPKSALFTILSLCIGLNGILFAEPIADIAACVLSVLLIRQEFVKADN